MARPEAAAACKAGMIRILVELDFDRDRLGVLSAFDASGKKVLGPIPVAARGSDALAKVHRNPRRDPLLPYGDTPPGSYVLRGVLKSGQRTAFPVAEFGASGVIVLEGIAGDAALAEANGRFQTLIEGGKPAKGGSLAATAGALRLSNQHQRALIAMVRKADRVIVEIVEHDCTAGLGTVLDDGSCAEHDPPQGVDMARDADLSRRDALRTGGAAGAMAFGLSVSFVAFEPSPARAQVRLAYGTASGTLSLYNQTSSNLSFTSSVGLCANSGNVFPNGSCVSTQQAGDYDVTATRFDNKKSATKTINVPSGGEGTWSVTDADF